MRNIGKLSASIAMLLATTAMANAADIIPDPVEPAPEVIPVASPTGWYLRGDIGYADPHTDDVHFTTYSGGCDACGNPAKERWSKFSKKDIDDTWLLQGGLGYQVNDYFRVDATYAYFDKTDFDGRSSRHGHFDCAYLSWDNDSPDTKCSSKDKSKLKVQTVMANAYFDLGNYNGFTPYVGGGIGGARVKWDDLKNDISCGGHGDCLNEWGEDYGRVHDSEHKGNKDWRFAWALHAGASFDLTCNTKIDAGYTYTHIEDGDMFDWTSDAVLTGTQGRSDDIDIHSGTVGLRYTFGGCAQPYVPQEVPVYK